MYGSNKQGSRDFLFRIIKKLCNRYEPFYMLEYAGKYYGDHRGFLGHQCVDYFNEVHVSAVEMNTKICNRIKLKKNNKMISIYNVNSKDFMRLNTQPLSVYWQDNFGPISKDKIEDLKIGLGYGTIAQGTILFLTYCIQSRMKGNRTNKTIQVAEKMGYTKYLNQLFNKYGLSLRQIEIPYQYSNRDKSPHALPMVIYTYKIVKHHG